MLILSRKPGESIVIDGRIVVTIVRLEGETVKVGIVAAREVPVHRQEVYDEIQRNNREALTEDHPQVPRFLAKPSAPRATESSPAVMGR
ncbi:MAG: carbon storage regulator [Verrucomicrobiota bacterium]|jgi:carbon storage regulator